MPRRIKRRRRIVGEDGVKKFIILFKNYFKKYFFIFEIFISRAMMVGKKYLISYFQKMNHKDLILNFWHLLRLG